MVRELTASADVYRRAFLYLSHHGGATCTECDPHCTVCPLLKDCPEGKEARVIGMPVRRSITRLRHPKRAGPAAPPSKRGAGRKACAGRSDYQLNLIPKRMTRGARIACTWLAFVAFCVPRIA